MFAREQTEITRSAFCLGQIGVQHLPGLTAELFLLHQHIDGENKTEEKSLNSALNTEVATLRGGIQQNAGSVFSAAPPPRC